MSSLLSLHSAGGKLVYLGGSTAGEAFVTGCPLDVFQTNEGVNIYTAEAAPGTGLSQALWRVRRTTYGADGSIKIRWAGNGGFEYAATNMPSLPYAAD